MTKRTAISGGAYTVYSWDNRGRMTGATNSTSGGTVTQTVSLWYDAFNDLIGRTLLSNYQGGVPQTTSTARFVYDLTGSLVDVAPDPTTPGNPSAAAGQGNAVLAFNGNGSLTDRFLWGPAVDQLLADERYSPSGSNVMPSSAGTNYWALGDNENSVRDWISNGALVDHVIYDSFGKIWSQSSTAVPFNFMHNGVFYDSAIGLEYHSQPSSGQTGRWYNAAIQRWLSEDPSGLGPDSNPYRYCGNSPTNFIDSSGLANKTVDTGIKGTKMFLEWFPHLNTGELKIIARSGEELAILKFIVNPETGEGAWHVVVTHAGKILPGVGSSLARKLGPAYEKAMQTIMARVGARAACAVPAIPAAGGAAAGGAAGKVIAGAAFGAALDILLNANTCGAEDPPQGGRVSPDEIGLTQQELEDIVKQALKEIEDSNKPPPAPEEPVPDWHYDVKDGTRWIEFRIQTPHGVEVYRQYDDQTEGG